MNTDSGMVRPRSRTHLIRPGRPRIQTTYQLQAELGGRIMDGDAAFIGAQQEILGWLAEKAPVELPAEAAQGISFILEDHGQRIECLAISENGVWSCRLSHPDAGMGDAIPPEPGRHWVTELCLRKLADKVLFGIHVTCSMLRDDYQPLIYTRPAIVRNLARRTGLRQVRDLRNEPWNITTPEDVDALEKLLLSPERLMPVIVISQPDKKRWSLSPNCPVYVVDTLRIAKDAQAIAHVAKLSYEMGFEWTKRVGMQWAVFDGAVRMYNPGLNFDEDSLQSHPLYRKDLIWYHKYNEQCGPHAFEAQLTDNARASNVRGRWVAPELMTVAQARLLESELNAAHSREHAKAKEDAFLEAMAKLTAIEKEKSVASETAAQMRELAAAKDSAIQSLNTRITALEIVLKAAEEDNQKWSDEAYQADKDREHYVHQNTALRNQIAALRASLESKTGEAADKDIEIPENYDELESWADRHLAGRLELHPRTRRSLKKACYEDVKLVYRCLLALANEYRNMKLGACEMAVWEGAMNELGVKCSGSIDRSRAGAEGETYFVEYPLGSTNKEFLELHLRKGRARDAHLCLAIYFFWHEETRQVVVGWLPSHLDNQLT